MKISVIIPTYKPKEYLYESLATLGQQTLDKKLFEVIIVLNGCCEPWHSQIKELCHTLLNNNIVRIIQTDKGGVSNARNIALDVSKGEYIAFIDDDDYVSPAYLEELLKNSNDKCVALSDCIYVEDASKQELFDNAHHRNFLKNSSRDNPSLFSSRVFFNGPCMKLIHRNIIGSRRFDTRFANGEDNLMMFLISDRIKHVSYSSSEAIYYRRIRSDSATTSHRTFWQRATNSLKLMGQYGKYQLKNPFGYNQPFVLSRYAAELFSILNLLR